MQKMVIPRGSTHCISALATQSKNSILHVCFTPQSGHHRWPLTLPLWALCHEHAGPNGMCNCTRDGGGPFEFDNQVLISSHRKLLWSKAMVVSVAEKPEQDSGRQD